MSDTKFTPGPWLPDDMWGTSEEFDERGFSVIASDSAVEFSNPTRGMVAWIGEMGASSFDRETAKANAQLIAAAPDLYAALTTMLPLFINRTIAPTSEQHVKDAVIAAMAALAKAGAA